MGLFNRKKDQETAAENFPFALSDAEWKHRLPPEVYRVLRQHGTERAFTSPLYDENRPGLYHCAGCGHVLYDASTKYNSGSGWPSFWQPASDRAIGTSIDYKIGMPRTECHCARCGGHLGHVFDDGPDPTGLRHCINGVCLTFHPAV